MKHILVVDDEKEIRDVLQQILSRQCYRVTTASNAAEAMQVVKSDRPDLVLTDLQMEDTDGLVLIDQIKEVFPAVPIILLTGVIFDPEVAKETIAKKASCYLEKTTPLHQIIHEIRRLLGDQQGSAEA